MDGRTAAKEIRVLEKTTTPPSGISPLRVDGRIPIIAVSASLYETDRSNLMENFDGWLLKPLGRCCPSLSFETCLADGDIDFTRVRTLLGCLQDPSKRSKEVYVSGQWERGGFFRGERFPKMSRRVTKTDCLDQVLARHLRLPRNNSICYRKITCITRTLWHYKPWQHNLKNVRPDFIVKPTHTRTTIIFSSLEFPRRPRAWAQRHAIVSDSVSTFELILTFLGYTACSHGF